MTSFFSASSSLIISASALLPAKSPFSCRTCAHRTLPTSSESNTNVRKSACSRSVVLATHGAENLSQESQSTISSENWNMIQRLGRIVCGVTAAASVAWVLPAVADQQLATVTPYSESADRMQVGLVNGPPEFDKLLPPIRGQAIIPLVGAPRRIQACPLDVNPNCVSTSSNNGGYAAPWIIPESSTSNAAKKIETAILATQRNAVILDREETPQGTYLVAEADGLLGRDVMEFLVREDVVTYRSMAKKVVYLYPFTTPIGDFDGQQKRLNTLEDELGWSIPSFENTYDPDTE